MAAAGTCLSDLSDKLLQRILFFAPAREAASTAALSRQWRPLWRTSGAVNIDSSSYDHLSPETPDEARQRHSGQRSFDWSKREAFIRGAEAALAAAAAEGPVRRLTFTVTEKSKIDVTHRPCALATGGIPYRSHHPSLAEHHLIHAVASSPAARLVEELRVDIIGLNMRCPLGLSALPREALRVLDVAGCAPVTAPPPPGAFPRLASLSLRRGTVSLADLWRIIDGAPRLATIHLESCYLPREQTMDYAPPPKKKKKEVQCFRLRCPTVTALVFADCTLEHSYCRDDDELCLEIDAPMLQYLKFKGAVHTLHRFSLKPQASSSMVRVDLRISIDHRGYIGARDRKIPQEQEFWRFLQNFNATKSLKLQLADFNMDEIAVADKTAHAKLLGYKLFDNVERLEVEAQYNPKSETSVVTLANLLHCCPMVRDLWLKLRTGGGGSWSASNSIWKESQKDFDKSVSQFRRRKRAMVSLRGCGDGDDGDDYKGFGIPALREESFCCLQSSLRRVSLHFCMEDSNCLGVQLAKFFAEKAMVLKEMFFDDGSQRMCEHINTSFRRWIADSEKRRQQSTTVVVLPIET